MYVPDLGIYKATRARRSSGHHSCLPENQQLAPILPGGFVLRFLDDNKHEGKQCTCMSASQAHMSRLLLEVLPHQNSVFAHLVLITADADGDQDAGEPREGPLLQGHEDRG
jgi:hypothetical protein